MPYAHPSDNDPALFEHPVTQQLLSPGEIEAIRKAGYRAVRLDREENSFDSVYFSKTLGQIETSEDFFEEYCLTFYASGPAGKTADQFCAELHTDINDSVAVINRRGLPCTDEGEEVILSDNDVDDHLALEKWEERARSVLEQQRAAFARLKQQGWMY